MAQRKGIATGGRGRLFIVKLNHCKNMKKHNKQIKLSGRMST